MVSFDRPFESPFPRPFPGFTRTSLVAPFWADVDIRQDGNIFFQVYTDVASSFLERASNDTRNLTGSANSQFTATWVLVATWDKVPNFPDGTIGFSDSLSLKAR